jgi:hypothetical protein
MRSYEGYRLATLAIELCSFGRRLLLPGDNVNEHKFFEKRGSNRWKLVGRRVRLSNPAIMCGVLDDFLRCEWVKNQGYGQDFI